MGKSFDRQLGAESGIQYNPLLDLSETASVSKYDRNAAIMARLTRGRIDKPFLLNRDNVFIKAGAGEPMRLNALNEAWEHIVEGVNNGVYLFVVQRLITSAAVIKYAVARMGQGATFTATVAGGVVTAISGSGGTGYVTGQELTITGVGTGAIATLTATNGVVTGTTITSGGTGYTVAPTVSGGSPISWTSETAIPVTPYLIAIKHLGCFNDGIVCQVHSDENRVSGSNEANDNVSLKISDKNGVLMFNYVGSLDPASVDDYNESNYLPDLVALYTDELEVTVGATYTQIPVNSNGYGFDANGFQKWAKSATLICFDEGGTGYTTQDYMTARQKLRDTNFDYGYISSGGSKSTALLTQCKQLAYEVDRPFVFDVGCGLSIDSAISFNEQLNIGGDTNAAPLCIPIWTSFRSKGYSGVNGKQYIGSATLLIAYACARNSVTNAYGYCEERKSPIAGRRYPINRSAITQDFTCSNFEKDKLAKAKINPAIGENYTGGFRYVFFDSLTAALVDNSKRKLFSVIDMSVDVQERITSYGKGLLQMDMDTVKRKMDDFLAKMRREMKASGWLTDPTADNPSGATDYFAYVVAPDATLVDKLRITVYPCFVGTVRQIELTQVLV